MEITTIAITINEANGIIFYLTRMLIMLYVEYCAPSTKVNHKKANDLLMINIASLISSLITDEYLKVENKFMLREIPIIFESIEERRLVVDSQAAMLDREASIV